MLPNNKPSNGGNNSLTPQLKSLVKDEDLATAAPSLFKPKFGEIAKQRLFKLDHHLILENDFKPFHNQLWASLSVATI